MPKVKPVKKVRPHQVGDPVIRAKAKPVKNVHAPEVRQVIQTLIDQMRLNNLIGMAAPQVGVSLRVFVTEIRATPTRKPSDVGELRVYINPKITESSKQQTVLVEGCGSLCDQNLFGPVRRPSRVTVTALDENSQPFTLKATGLLAKCVQHELDHLNGIVCIDRFTNTKKVMTRDHYLAGR